MKRILAGVAAVCVLGGAWLAQAQQPAEPELYVVVSYFKTAPGMQDAYREFVTGTSKKFYQELLKEQPTLVHWSVARVMFTGVDGPSYDFVGAAVYAGPPPEPKTYPDVLYQKVSGMTRADYMKKLDGLRTAVGSDLLRSVARVAAPGTIKEGDFRAVNQLRVSPGMNDEFTEMVRTTTLPLMDARRGAGELKSWSMWTRVFPAGAGTAYDALAVLVLQGHGERGEGARRDQDRGALREGQRRQELRYLREQRPGLRAVAVPAACTRSWPWWNVPPRLRRRSRGSAHLAPFDLPAQHRLVCAGLPDDETARRNRSSAGPSCSTRRR